MSSFINQHMEVTMFDILAMAESYGLEVIDIQAAVDVIGDDRDAVVQYLEWATLDPQGPHYE
jgi:hypothetical protein